MKKSQGNVQKSDNRKAYDIFNWIVNVNIIIFIIPQINKIAVTTSHIIIMNTQYVLCLRISQIV